MRRVRCVVDGIHGRRAHGRFSLRRCDDIKKNSARVRRAAIVHTHPAGACSSLSMAVTAVSAVAYAYQITPRDTHEYCFII